VLPEGEGKWEQRGIDIGERLDREGLKGEKTSKGEV